MVNGVNANKKPTTTLVGICETTASLVLSKQTNKQNKMPRPDVDQLDSQIARLRGGGTLTENEVKVLCDKVRFYFSFDFHFVFCRVVSAGHCALSRHSSLLIINVTMAN
jgi:hypothetical protein